MATDPTQTPPADTPRTTERTAQKKIIDAAVVEANLSPCQSKRGVVIFHPSDNVVVARGHNEKPKGFLCDGSDTCKATCRTRAVHAEQSAMLTAGLWAQGRDLLHVKTVDGKAVPSGGPSCIECSKLILHAGIVGVWLLEDEGWKRYEALEFHALSLSAALRASEGGRMKDQGAGLAAVGNDTSVAKDYRQATSEERAMARGFVTLWTSVGVQDAEDWLYALRNRAELLASLDEDDSREAQDNTPSKGPFNV